ncbi:LysR family transcriptional regulator [Plantactinospora sp. GCM10030261]|uniref:LysR family transcriptional regulator n=1 Tax=Plantactinospora sp. GCM10030261 TaxID=3273420 RepID=UPI0036075064
MLELWTLRVFIEVGKQGSLSRAGEVLSMSQPAVSRQMSGLERRLGVKLFRRVPRGMLPTPAGDVALRLARDIFDRLRTFEASLSAFTDVTGGQLRISGFASANSSFVPAAIQRFTAAYPGVAISLVQLAEEAQLAALRDGTVDLVLRTSWGTRGDRGGAICHPTDSGRADALHGLRVVSLVDEELAIALPADHRFAGTDQVNLRDLADEPWIEGAHPDCLGPLPRLTEALGREPRVTVHCDDWNAKQALVAAGGGMMLAPTSARGTVRGDIVLRGLQPALPRRRLLALTTDTPFCPPTVTAMLRTLTKVIGATSPHLPEATG